MGVSAIPPERPFVIWTVETTPPPGYVKMNAPTVSRTAYAWAFSKIGTRFGAGDGSTTFVLGPDMRGEFARGWDDGRGVDSGRVLGSGQMDALQDHGHGGAGTNGVSGDGGYYGVYAGASAIGGQGWVNSAFRTALETRPRNVAGMFCIAIAP